MCKMFVWGCIHGGHRTSLCSWFSPPTFMEVPGIKLKLSDLGGNYFSHWAHLAGTILVYWCQSQPVAFLIEWNVSWPEANEDFLDGYFCMSSWQWWRMSRELVKACFLVWLLKLILEETTFELVDWDMQVTLLSACERHPTQGGPNSESENSMGSKVLSSKHSSLWNVKIALWSGWVPPRGILVITTNRPARTSQLHCTSEEIAL